MHHTLVQRRTPSPPPTATGATGATTRSLSRKGSNGSFVFNVSDDEVIERDVDLEIEARIRSGTLPGSDSESDLPPPTRVQRTASTRSMPRRTSGAPAPATKSTLSQRMLSALQRKKNQTASRTKRSGSILLEVVQAEQGPIAEMPRPGSNHSMGADIDGLVVPDPFYDPSQDSVYMSDDENGPISHSISSSCKDRLEARISDRLLQNKSSLSAHPEGPAPMAQPEANELSIVYTNRRTYPAESSKRTDVRHSDNHMDARYERAGVTPAQRANRAMGTYYEQQYGSQQYSQHYGHVEERHPEQPFSPYVQIRGPIEPTMEILDSNKSLPVAFHFQGQSNASPPKHRPVYEPAFASTRPNVARPRKRGDEIYATLSESLVQIEQVVDGLENCLMASSFSSLAVVALRELELLRESTQQIRTNGTTQILAEIGRPHSQLLGLYRQLVARAASLQHRIDVLIHRVRTTC